MALSTELTEDLGTKWTKSGRLATVSGEEEIRQSITIGLLYDADLTAPALSEGAIEAQRGSIESAVRTNPKSQQPIRVVVNDVDYEDQTVSYEIRTRRVRLPLVVE